jgi:hypothetical protein
MRVIRFAFVQVYLALTSGILKLKFKRLLEGLNTLGGMMISLGPTLDVALRVTLVLD